MQRLDLNLYFDYAYSTLPELRQAVLKFEMDFVEWEKPKSWLVDLAS